MTFPAFSISRLPRIEFGSGSFKKIPPLLTAYGKRVLIVTGRQSFYETEHWAWLSNTLQQQEISFETLKISAEPSPRLVDEAVNQFKNQKFDAVLGIGGGSVLDAAKAIAGLLKPGNSVMDHLEGVGPELPYHGPATPFIAVPTTAGTGSEATKNAVLSTHGPDGFKKSFRDEQLIPEFAIVDPDLLASCSPAQIAANGMDAFTQLLESYVSSKANSFTDALALSGLNATRNSLPAWYKNSGDTAARSNMAYAALISGITLAQVGLGSVHGLASPLGAFFPIPHGVVCGTLVATATQINISAMLQREPANPALAKYAQIGRLLSGNNTMDDAAGCTALVNTLNNWTALMALPRLGAFGISNADIEHIVAHSRGSSMKTNPIVLTDAELIEILMQRM